MKKSGHFFRVILIRMRSKNSPARAQFQGSPALRVKKVWKLTLTLQIGNYLVLGKLIEESRVRTILLEQFSASDTGLILDLASYAIVTENNAGQYYPDYAYHHPLLTEDMKVYTDTKVSDFLKSITTEQRIGFLNAWNKERDHRGKIYISYDSTNKVCQAGDIEMAEFGHEKVKAGKTIVNQAVAYDGTNREPLFYEAYPGSIVDVAQLQYMLEKAKSYGYQNVGFILDRGYFSEPNIHYMDQCHYSFIIMVKGMADFVSQLVMEKRETFETDRHCVVRKFHCYGKTVRKKLYESDEQERYFHIYYSSEKNNAEREKLEGQLDTMKKSLDKLHGKKYKDMKLEGLYKKYYDPIVSKDGVFLYGREIPDAIGKDLKLCGYFVIITSDKMTAQEALELYKSRDVSEKLFRGDKSYLGNRAFRTYSGKATENKIFIEFIALILRNRYYTKLKDLETETGRRENYLTVTAAVRELEKIELIRQMDKVYKIDHAITRTEKEILKAFKIDSSYIRRTVQKLSDTLTGLEKKEGE